VRVATLNVHGWRDGNGDHNAAQLSLLIAKAKVDVLALQEFLPDGRPRGEYRVKRWLPNFQPDRCPLVVGFGQFCICKLLVFLFSFYPVNGGLTTVLRSAIQC
jgi:hypothetical protein